MKAQQQTTPTKEGLHTQGELPKELFLYVTGTGERDTLEDYELLLRTKDHAILLPQNSEFGKLTDALISAYNERKALLEHLENCVELLKWCGSSLTDKGKQTVKEANLFLNNANKHLRQ